jgi:hypothetical protein
MYIKNPRNILGFWTVGFVLLFLVSSVTFAQVWNKKTNLTVGERIEVPGAVLEPGKYVVKLVESNANRHIVRFMNEREDKVISTVIAIPNERLKVTGDTKFSFYERPVGEPRAMRAWFYPGDNFGQEFVYPKHRAVPIAAAAYEPVLSVADVEEPVMRAEVKPEQPAARELKQAEVTPAAPPVQMAQAAPPARPAPAPTPEPEPQKLPRTAGLGALFGLLGVAALATAAGLRFVLQHKR